ncbi:deacylase [Microbacterium sp. 18062]|uniref:deacylase n=1 Tax=Microbacterium sp. 18062 TaxID=2681410 RepID=UPI001357EF6C|nr:deacylase [Microbacterium sp. 18062]
MTVDLRAPAADLIPRPDAEQRAWIDRARRGVDAELIRTLVVDMVSTPSPTGDERALAEVLASRLDAIGLDGRVQPIDDRQANATGRLRGRGDGEDLLLYAPIDTLTTGDPAEDLELLGGSGLRHDLRAEATVAGDVVMGLGASNPKGHAAAIVAAVDAVRRAGIPLRGDVLIGLCAGGMPTENRPLSGSSRRNAGQGAGCAFFLDRGGIADHAIICKPGWAVHWEEVGLAWFEWRVEGTYHYVGSRHRMPYRNPIVIGAEVIRELESWFVAYSERWTDGLVAPQGNIGAFAAGWPHLLAVSPGVATLRFDLRTSPRATLAGIRRDVARAAAEIGMRHDVRISSEMVLSVPGSWTDPDEWIVRAAVSAWEDAEGRAHEPILGNSGATDANILRRHGVPTARIGMTRVGDYAPLPPDFSRGMNAVDLRDVAALARTLIQSIVLTCTRAPGSPRP